MTPEASPEPAPQQQDQRTPGGDLAEGALEALDLGVDVAGTAGELGSCFQAIPDCSFGDCAVVDCAPGCV